MDSLQPVGSPEEEDSPEMEDSPEREDILEREGTLEREGSRPFVLVDTFLVVEHSHLGWEQEDMAQDLIETL